jgi:hypothetical protein
MSQTSPPLFIISRIFDFKGEVLAEAVEKTFEKRKTPINLNAAIFDASFARERDKEVQWRSFLRKSKLDNTAESFEEIVAAVTDFLKPIAISVADQKNFARSWTAPGPWR